MSVRRQDHNAEVRRGRGKWLRDWTGSVPVQRSLEAAATTEGGRFDDFAGTQWSRSSRSVPTKAAQMTASNESRGLVQWQSPPKRIGIEELLTSAQQRDTSSLRVWPKTEQASPCQAQRRRFKTSRKESKTSVNTKEHRAQQARGT